MRNDHDGAVVGSEVIDAAGDNLEGVDIESGIGFVQNGQSGIEDEELKNLVPLLFAAREAFVDRSFQQGIVDADDADILFENGSELDGVDGFFAVVFA